MMKLCSLLVFVVCLVGFAQTAEATFHFMQIEQVVGGVDGDDTAQAIQLRMRTGFQNVLSRAHMRAWDATGQNPVVIVDFETNVVNHAPGVRVLITSANFGSVVTTPLVSDFTMANLIPSSYLSAGSLTYEDDFGTIYWRLSWGGAGYTGATTGAFSNDADGEFGPPFPGPLPSCGAAIQFTGASTAPSTTNAADYALTSGPILVTDNRNTISTVPEGTCATPTPTPTPLDPVDHYKVYSLLSEDVQIPDVVVEDQFGIGFVDLRNLGKLGVPVSKAIVPDLPSGVLLRPFEHLAWYEFFDLDRQPLRFARLKNQFTRENKGAIWKVGDGHFLLVPALKDGQGEITLGQHWKCYDAVTFFDPDVAVNLRDQFHLEPNVKVGPGRYLCNPAEKNFERPPSLPDEHLACYAIIDAPLGEGHFLEDQFGNHLVVVENPELLCLPSLKFVPEPGVLLSLGPGLMLLGWLDRRRRRRAIGR